MSLLELPVQTTPNMWPLLLNTIKLTSGRGEQLIVHDVNVPPKIKVVSKSRGVLKIFNANPWCNYQWIGDIDDDIYFAKV